MVRIYHHNLKFPLLDEEAVKTFRTQWNIYRKLVDNDYLSHREAYYTLHRILNNKMDNPFSFVDLACGDAHNTVENLRGTKVGDYIGIDLSDAALKLAEQAVGSLNCAVELEEADFVNFQEVLTQRVDVIWIGLSLHHLTTHDKADFMKKAKDALKNYGLVLIYEPSCLEGEDRVGYVKRFEQINEKLWTALTPDEWNSVMKHVSESDIPESASSWIRLGRESGFVDCREVFRDVTGLYSLFLYQRDH
jgi:SAM-dependent methyltransferase